MSIHDATIDIFFMFKIFNFYTIANRYKFNFQKNSTKITINSPYDIGCWAFLTTRPLFIKIYFLRRWIKVFPVGDDD